MVPHRDETGSSGAARVPGQLGSRMRAAFSAARELLSAILCAWSLARHPAAPPDQAERALARLQAARDAVPWGGWFSEAAFAICAQAPRVGLMVLLLVLAWV